MLYYVVLFVLSFVFSNIYFIVYSQYSLNIRWHYIYVSQFFHHNFPPEHSDNWIPYHQIYQKLSLHYRIQSIPNQGSRSAIKIRFAKKWVANTNSESLLSLLCTLLRTARESTPRSLAGQLRFFRKFSLISEDSEHTLPPSASRGFGGLDFDDCRTQNRQSSELDDCRSLWHLAFFLPRGDEPILPLFSSGFFLCSQQLSWNWRGKKKTFVPA